MDVSTGNILNVFYELLKPNYAVIRKYGYNANETGEFLLLNFIPNTREKTKTGALTKMSRGFGYVYITAFIPKINNGDDVFPNSKRIEDVQNDINSLIDGFSGTEKVNSISMYLDADPTVLNDLNNHSTVIFRVLCNYS